MASTRRSDDNRELPPSPATGGFRAAVAASWAAVLREWALLVRAFGRRPDQRAGRPLPDPRETPADAVQPDASPGPGPAGTEPPPPRVESAVVRRFSPEALMRRFEARRAAREARRQEALRREAADIGAADADGGVGFAAATDEVPAADTRDPVAPAPGETAATLAAAEPVAVPVAGGAELPPADILRPDPPRAEEAPEILEENRRTIQDVLDSFGIDAEAGGATCGPRVTRYEIHVARGVRVESVSALANNLAMELRAVSIRILAPVPGHDYVGLEVPNRDPGMVGLGSMVRGPRWRATSGEIPLALGKGIGGDDVLLDLAKAPHLLVAGATGSGKSVCLNSVLASLLYRFTPDRLRLVLVDPKVVEFNVFNGVPHLLTPVITDVKVVVIALRWLLAEMERRYRLLAAVGARNLASFNGRPPDPEPVFDEDGEPVPASLPYLVLVIDELADIMMSARADVETSLARIAQMSRAVGIHAIVATQRPSVDVITGVIKANFPTRIAFQVSAQADSRTVLDGKGAESLLGRGDMLFKPPGIGRLQRIQGAMIEDDEVEALTDWLRARGRPEFDPAVICPSSAGTDPDAPAGGDSGEDEALIQEAAAIIVRDRRASTSYIQRRLRIGYNRAATIMDILESRGIVGPQPASAAPREILAGRAEDDDWDLG